MIFQDIGNSDDGQAGSILDDKSVANYFVTESQFNFLTSTLRKLTGIHLEYGSKNLSLVSSRMNKLVIRRKVPSLESCIKSLRKGDARITREFVSIMTTNTTAFFREREHFDWLSTNLSALLQEKKSSGDRDFRIWCSAASTGQEVYTILIILLEAGLDLAYFNLHFLATDIDLAVLNTASKGIYAESNFETVPALLREKYFSPSNSHKLNGERTFKLKREYRNLVHFAPFNLMNSPFPFQHSFDLIFCRNVLIYFDFETSENIIKQSLSVLKREGLLFLGHSESGFVKQIPMMEQVVHSLYRKSKIS
ncbi:MAG: protein-glutamate O-methyltransferase CheR [Bdellovibrionales bacterium]|jgi:chemotaxis protein methyltransferase CheR|nr:protein-glutamate O-methyltransferase CheR [Bdellovibrionales bacterium]MBT7767269.1 protein-glutamate O-methyltransferase CheR [Bdellovibrionales bacterium]